MTEKSKDFSIVPADNSEYVENCVVIPEGVIPEQMDIIKAAVENKAVEDNSNDEAGDDQYMVQFPGCEQELLDEYAILEKIRSLVNEQLW